MWSAGLDEAQSGIKIARRNINNFIYADDTTLMAESKEELKSLLMKVKEESEKAGLKSSTFRKLRSVFVPAFCTVLLTFIHCSLGSFSIRSNLLNLCVTFTV